MLSKIPTQIPTINPKSPGSPPKAMGALSKPSSGTGVKKIRSKKPPVSSILLKYRRAKMMVKYLTLKKEVMKGQLTKGDLFLLARFQSKLKKMRKMAAPELIKLNMKRRMSRGKGKRRGSDLSKLMGAPIKK